MGYADIKNLYADKTILLFKECYALEKIHGTSAHLAWDGATLTFFSGGAPYDQFVSLFDESSLKENFEGRFGTKKVKVHGEAYGGKMQGMSTVYGKDLKFIVFDVLVDEVWLSVTGAEAVAEQLGLEFVDYHRVPAIEEALDAERTLPSVQAKRNGILEDKVREGIVVRPFIECYKNNGGRIIAKHKNPEYEERMKPPKLADPDREAKMKNAEAIAEEFVVPMRLEHVLDDLKSQGIGLTRENTGKVVQAMINDIFKEASDEVVDSKEVRKTIGSKAAQLYLTWLENESSNSM